MDNLMHKRAAARFDVHDQCFVMRRVVAKWCTRTPPENVDGILLVTGLVPKQPDVDDMIRVLTEVVLLEPLNGPADCTLGMSPNGAGRIVANHHEGLLQNGLKLRDCAGRELTWLVRFTRLF